MDAVGPQRRNSPSDYVGKLMIVAVSVTVTITVFIIPHDSITFILVDLFSSKESLMVERKMLKPVAQPPLTPATELRWLDRVEVEQRREAALREVPTMGGK
ncbi:hypothetical protein BDR04DRAFT_1163559 [Suillus decipiens]|nr:hypothetical protein BDR04DRAFT_1163559 [Suillus decipiens]